MCRLFDEWKAEIKTYCEKNRLNYEIAEKMAKSWGKNDIALQYIDKTKGKNGLMDDTPAPVVLWIRRNSDGKIEFEQTEYTEKYLGVVS